MDLGSLSMLNLSTFLDFCEIHCTKQSLSKLDKIVNAFLISHVHKWLEKLKEKVQNEIIFECSACYNNTGEHKRIEELLHFDDELKNDEKADEELMKEVMASDCSLKSTKDFTEPIFTKSYKIILRQTL